MTKEEAIENLKELIDTYITCHGEEDTVAVSLDNVDVEALDMAIKALEQEPCCNCIEFKRYAKEMGFEIEQEPILDKIRAEIEQEIIPKNSDQYDYEAKWQNLGLRMALKVIDKYKLESENK